MDSQVKEYSWNTIAEFRSLDEFKRFAAWMDVQVKNGSATDVPVSEPYMGAPSFDERWVKRVPDGRVWRLVGPDGPFHGLFERV